MGKCFFSFFDEVEPDRSAYAESPALTSGTKKDEKKKNDVCESLPIA